MNKSMLFVSRYCPHSKQFLDIFETHEISKTFEIYFIEDNIDNLPSFVKSVPTLHIPILEKPLVGSDSFAWLKKITKDISIDVKETPIQKVENIVEENKGIKDFDNTMSGGYSDDFSFIHNENPQKHSFEFLDVQEKLKPQISNIKNNTDDDLSKRLEQLQQERSNNSDITTI